MRSGFDDMLGNQRLRERLASDIRADRLSHAYVIEGAEGFGKHTLTLRIAAALACEHRYSEDFPLPCRTCAACRKILSGNSPDVIYVNKGDKATMGVEVIRAMHADVFVAPNDFEDKIYVIEDAHLMTVQAQNAFLLTLEEPPAYVRFFLLCNSSAPLLETVRSRAPTLRLEPIPADSIGEHLCAADGEARALRNHSPREFLELLVCADGSMGKAKQLLDPKRRKPIMERRDAAREFVQLCTRRHNSMEALRFFKPFWEKRGRDEIVSQLNECLVCVRDLLLCKQSDRVPLCFFSEREEATALSYQFSAPELLRIGAGLENAINRVQANANIRLTLTSLAIEVGLLS